MQLAAVGPIVCAFPHRGGGEANAGPRLCAGFGANLQPALGIRGFGGCRLADLRRSAAADAIRCAHYARGTHRGAASRFLFHSASRALAIESLAVAVSS